VLGAAWDASAERLDWEYGRLRAMTSEQLQILQHALGVDEYGQGSMYRNHFCAGGKDEEICRELVEMGYMTRFTRSYLPYYNCTVTNEGKAAMRRESPKPPKLTRSQKRYRDFLNADTGFSFGEYLRDYCSGNRA
jgi:hypothetical protein